MIFRIVCPSSSLSYFKIHLTCQNIVEIPAREAVPVPKLSTLMPLMKEMMKALLVSPRCMFHGRAALQQDRVIFAAATKSKCLRAAEDRTCQRNLQHKEMDGWVPCQAL